MSHPSNAASATEISAISANGRFLEAAVQPVTTAAFAEPNGFALTDIERGGERLEPQRAPTLQQVAQAAGIGIATASRALSGRGSTSPQTQEKVLRAVRELGFAPNASAQRLAKGRCDNTIGIFSSVLDLGVGTRKVQIIQKLLGARGFNMPVYAYQGSSVDARYQTSMIAMLCRQNYRALVYDSSGHMNDETVAEINRYVANGGLIVAHSYSFGFPVACDQVTFDVKNTLYNSARHLLDLGHRRIGYCFGGVKTKHRTARDDGFDLALLEFGLERRPEWILIGTGHLEHELDGELAAQQFLALPRHDRPTGLCIVNDTAAAAFLATVQDAGVSVPRDLSIVGHDDRAIARFCRPALTTLSHPVEAIAARVVEMLCQRLDGAYQGAPRIETVCGELIVRQSTGPPSAT